MSTGCDCYNAGADCEYYDEYTARNCHQCDGDSVNAILSDDDIL